MTQRGLIDAARFAACRGLSAQTPLFRRELAVLPDERFVHLSPDIPTEGSWRIAPLLLRWASVPAHLDPVPNQVDCAESYRLLAADTGILGAGFSRLLPGTVIAQHFDRPLAGVLRFHLCLEGDAGAGMEIDGFRIPMRQGHGIVFDQSLPHSAWHHGREPRDCLIVDFVPTAEEVALLVRDRGGVTLGPTAGPSRT